MAASDEEYVAELDSDERDDDLGDDDLGDDDEDDELDTRNAGQGSSGRSRGKRKKARDGHEFEVSRTWETLVEGADGTISSTVEGLLEAGKRKR